jgi:DNA-binding FadR family transcriptional regulator
MKMKKTENKTERLSLYLTKEQVEECEKTKEMMMEFHTGLPDISNNAFLSKLINIGLKRLDEDLTKGMLIKEAGFVPATQR